MDSDTYTGGAFLTGIIVFIIVWIYSINEWGLLLGLMFGWIPAMIAGSILGFLWPLLIILLLIGYLMIQS